MRNAVLLFAALAGWSYILWRLRSARKEGDFLVMSEERQQILIRAEMQGHDKFSRGEELA